MENGIDMRRLHQGCGESLQSNLPGIANRKSSQLPGLADNQPKAFHRIRREPNQRRDRGDDR